MRLRLPWNPTPRRRRRPRHSEAGFTLIEMLITAFIVALIASAVAEGLIATAYMSADQRHHSEADALAQQDQERLKGMSSKQLYGLDQTWSVTVDGTTYTGTSSATFLSESGASTCSPAGLGAASYYSVRSSVTWAANTRLPVVEEGLITPPAGGALLVQVEDQTATPLSGVTVSASGPDFESASTDATGCAIFGGLPVGAYNVSLSDPGYVDPNGLDGHTTPETTSQVSSTGTSAPDAGNPLYMGLAGTFSATLAGADGTSTGEGDALSWYGNGATLSMSAAKDVTSSTMTSHLSTTALFPFAFTGPSYVNNYQVWAGPCPQMRPPTGEDQFSVTPGSSLSKTVTEPVLDVVVNYGGARVKPAHVKITFTWASGSPSCTDKWSPTISANAATAATGSLANPGQPFANAATTGSNASASGGSGTLSVCADYSNHQATVSPISDSFAASTLVTVNVPSSGGNGTCP